MSDSEIKEGVLRTPDDRFEALSGYDFEPNYIKVNDLRMHYVDEGSTKSNPVLLLHGEPSVAPHLTVVMSTIESQGPWSPWNAALVVWAESNAAMALGMRATLPPSIDGQ